MGSRPLSLSCSWTQVFTSSISYLHTANQYIPHPLSLSCPWTQICLVSSHLVSLALSLTPPLLSSLFPSVCCHNWLQSHTCRLPIYQYGTISSRVNFDWDCPWVSAKLPCETVCLCKNCSHFLLQLLPLLACGSLLFLTMSQPLFSCFSCLSFLLPTYLAIASLPIVVASRYDSQHQGYWHMESE